MNKITMLETTMFLFQPLHHLCAAKYRIVQMMSVTRNKAIGKIPDKKAFKNAGDGVKRVNSLS